MSGARFGVLAAWLAFGAPASGQEVFEVGEWVVFRNVDDFTDEVSCAAYFRLLEDGVIFSRDVEDRGPHLIIPEAGVSSDSSVRFRYGEAPPEPGRPPTTLEIATTAVFVEGEEFRRAVEASRLRVQVSGGARGRVVWDILLGAPFEAVRRFLRESVECVG